jgi:hypothetical protein
MPRGFAHETSTNETASMHVTLISQPYRWVDLLHDLVDELAERDDDLRRHVPLAACRAVAEDASFDFGPVERELAAGVWRCFQRTTFPGAAARHIQRLLDELPPLGDGLAAAAPEAIGPAQRITKRAGMICQIQRDGDRAVIRFPGGHLRGPLLTLEALRFIATAEAPFRLADVPGPLSRESSGVLVRRLIREGLLELADPVRRSAPPRIGSSLQRKRRAAPPASPSGDR